MNTTNNTTTETRPLHVIAAEIKREWKNVYFGAVPYLDVMRSLDNVSDFYGYDSGKSVVIYFLSNASSFRGEAAKRIKNELKSLIK
jgi:hypothetical protein